MIGDRVGNICGFKLLNCYIIDYFNNGDLNAQEK